jgi:hypothetical protein
MEAEWLMRFVKPLRSARFIAVQTATAHPRTASRFPSRHGFPAGMSDALRSSMWDLIFILATIAFFIVSLSYVEGCRRL